MSTVVTTPTVPCQPGVARSTVTWTARSVRGPPGLHLLLEGKLLRRARPDHNLDGAEALALGDDLGDHRSQRGEADAPRHDDQVPARRGVQPPIRSERAAQPEGGADLQSAQRARDGADVANRMRDRAVSRGFALIEIATSPTG